MTQAGNESVIARWAPQVAGWVIAALVGLGVYQSRIAVLERTDLEHDRRLADLEEDAKANRRVLQRVELLLERIDVSHVVPREAGTR